jgi:hypothetical protein
MQPDVLVIFRVLHLKVHMRERERELCKEARVASSRVMLREMRFSRVKRWRCHLPCVWGTHDTDKCEVYPFKHIGSAGGFLTLAAGFPNTSTSAGSWMVPILHLHILFYVLGGTTSTSGAIANLHHYPRACHSPSPDCCCRFGSPVRCLSLSMHSILPPPNIFLTVIDNRYHQLRNLAQADNASFLLINIKGGTAVA